MGGVGSRGFILIVCGMEWGQILPQRLIEGSLHGGIVRFGSTMTELNW